VHQTAQLPPALQLVSAKWPGDRQGKS